MSGQAPKTVRGYELRDVIGDGGFGAVYRAYQPVVNREVAIKVILPEYANNPEFILRFEREAHFVARLEHPHIVPIYDYWRDPDGAYLVMRYLKGGSLSAALSKNGAWGLVAASRLIDQIAGALTIAHQQNVVHQDLKPGNILFDEPGNAYLVDFGIAREVFTLTPDINARYGSPGFASPEQMLGEFVTPRADIYSFGLVIYAMLTGEPAFDDTSATNMLRKSITETIPPLMEKRPDLPPELDMIIRRATSKDPNARYPDVFALADDFRRVIGLQPVVETHPPPKKQFPENSTINLQLRRDEPGTKQLNVKPPEIDQATGVLPVIPAVRPPNEFDQATGVLPVIPAVRPPNDFDQATGVLPNLPRPIQTRNPFKGLRAFDEADAQDFFGRTNLILQLIETLQEDTRFLAVVGPSGSGKSSVVSAGMIPAIRHGALPNSERWLVSKMVPGAHPLKELEQTLLRVAFEKPETSIEAMLRADDTGLQHVIQDIIPNNTQLLIFIDQFEETFTLTEEDAERAAFLNNLTHALTVPGSPLRVIIALRADFYDRPLLFPGFSELIRKNTEVVIPLTPDDIEQIIKRPASSAGLIPDPDLVTAMVADLREQAGALPLLQFALTELYERRENEHLTLKAYREIGGVSGALVRRANDIYAQLDERQQTFARQIFLRLVALGEGTNDTRRRAALSDLLSISDQPEDIRALLDMFGKYRLLTFDHDPDTRAPTVEIAHESLIRQWEQLREWLENNRTDLRLQQLLAVASNEWARGNEDTSFLASGARLTQFETLMNSQNVALSGRERDYIRASIALRQRAANRLRLFIATLILITLIALGSALFAIDRQQRAEIERDRADLQAEISRSRELAMSAITGRNRLDRNLLTSLQALHSFDTLEGRRSLLTGLLSNPRLISFLPDQNNPLYAVALNPDATVIATAGDNHNILLWDANTRQLIRQLRGQHTAPVRDLEFSPDGTRLASAAHDGRVVIWDWDQGSIIEGYEGENGEPEVWAIAYSPDGNMLATAGGDGWLTVWDLTRDTIEQVGKAWELAGHDETIYTLDFSPDGKTLASGGADNTIRLWDMTALDEEQEPVVLTGHENWVQTLQFSPNGSLLASSGPENKVYFWDMQSKTVLGNFRTNHTNWVKRLAFSPSGALLATASLDNSIRVWDLATGQQIGTPFTGHTDAIWDVAFLPDNQRMVSVSSDSSAILWNLQPRQPLAQRLTGHTQPVWSLAYSGEILASSSGSTGRGGDFNIHLWNNDGTERGVLEGHIALVKSVAVHENLLASGSADRTVRLWNVETGEQLEMLRGHQGAVTGIVFHADGSLIASSDDEGTVILWSDGWKKTAEWSQETGVTNLALSGNVLAASLVDGRITLWDVATQESLGELTGSHTDLIEALAFSPDGKIMASGSRDNTIVLWDMTTLQPIGQPLKFHTNWVSGLSFSPDGKLLASASRDNTLQLWDVAERQPLGLPLVGHTNWVNAVQFSPDGKRLASAGWDNSVILWDVSLEGWSALACQIANRNLTHEEWGDSAGVPLCPNTP